ncbi:hypothetical protein [Ensifer adhaerens]|uniref:hypothetical protein n=1 Tax=Ensifer adhaerens TaxID=106592 RepID=UPI003CD0230F
MNCYINLGLAATIVTMVGGNALAADVSPLLTKDPQTAEGPSGWSFSVAPYFWMAGLSGETKQFGLPTVEMDADFGDILSNLDFAFMAAGEARNGRFSVIGDIMYTKLGADGDTPDGILATGVDVTSQTFSGLLGVGYAVIDAPQGHLDLVGGVRIWSVETTIRFNGGILGGIERNDDASWLDGIVGLRGRYSLTPHVYLTGWGLVGGGGADIDWDVAMAIGYEFNDRISAIAGYRALGVDYNNDGFLFDAVQQGPILGLAVKF